MRFGSFPTRLNSVVLTEFSSYLVFVVDGLKLNARKIFSNAYCRALAITSVIQTSSTKESLGHPKKD